MRIVDLKEGLVVRLPYAVELLNYKKNDIVNEHKYDIITIMDGEIILLNSDTYRTTNKKGEWYKPFKK